MDEIRELQQLGCRDEKRVKRVEGLIFFEY
jgi:hypothetical protein